MGISTLHTLIFLFNTTVNENIFNPVAGIILKNLDKVPSSTITELADMCFTSPATITRLIKAVGCNNFGEFKSDIAKILKNYRFMNRCMPHEISSNMPFPTSYLQYLRSILDDIESSYDPALMNCFVDALHAANQIFVFATEVSEHARLQFQYDLVIAGKPAIFLTSEELQLDAVKKMKRGDVLLVTVSNSMHASYIFDIMKKSHDKGLTILAIANKNTPGIKGLADHIIGCNTSGTAIDHYSYNIYLSLITMAYRNRYIEGN